MPASASGLRLRLRLRLVRRLRSLPPRPLARQRETQFEVARYHLYHQTHTTPSSSQQGKHRIQTNARLYDIIFELQTQTYSAAAADRTGVRKG